jgi:hypothetical protein
MKCDEENLWSYLAGFIDADGSVSLSVTVVHGRLSFKPSLCLYVGERDYGKISDVLDLLGGHLFFDDRRHLAFSTVPIWHIVVSSQEALLRVLKRLLPHLRIKRAQAETLIAAVEYRKVRGRKAVGSVEEDFRDKIQKLNARRD